MLVLLASPRWLWCSGEYLLVSYSMIFCMEPEYIRQDISATCEKLIKPTYRAHLFHQVSCTLRKWSLYGVVCAKHCSLSPIMKGCGRQSIVHKGLKKLSSGLHMGVP